ncbi:MAG: hypothetical protein DME28_05970 [Verrucomicrobia bacterium]|nr:MAG: hypothetical protein DME28_05970 [Verrucomicrobiota bacterium]
MTFFSVNHVACATLFFTSAVAAVAQRPEPRKLMGTVNEESSWSPDGKTIAFDSIRSGKLNIYLATRDTRAEAHHVDECERLHARVVAGRKADRVRFRSQRTQRNLRCRS